MVRNPIAHAATVSFPVLLLAVTLTAQTGDQTSPTTAAPGASKVRIVRLSEVKGGVQIDRNNGRGLEKAITNLPIVEKNRVETGNGVAEIEFEDNSTLRVAPDSVVVFPTLERMPGGTTVSSVQLVKGMAYVSLMKTAGNEFNLLFGDQNLRLPSGSHVRLDLGDTQAKLAVLDAGVHIESPSGVMDVPRKRTVTFALADSSQPVVAKEVASNSFDEWDHKAVDYHGPLGGDERVRQLALFLRHERDGLLRRSFAGMWAGAAPCMALFRERRVGPLLQRLVGLL